MTSTCKSCGRAIIWITDQNDTRHPLNPDRVRVYFTLEDQPHKGRFAATPDGKADLYYVSHFTTCPNASKHSKSGKKT